MTIESDTQAKVVETIPLWLAVAITVLVSMPFGLWLGKYNFTMWCAFIVWAQYFALGAKPSCLRIILPSFSYAAGLTAITLWALPIFSFLPTVRVEGDLAISATLFVGIAFIVYSMKFSPVFQEGSLPFFNGIAMALGVYFTGSFPDLGSAALAPLIAGAWTILMGVVGCALGVFNVWITFPKTQQ